MESPPFQMLKEHPHRHASVAEYRFTAQPLGINRNERKPRIRPFKLFHACRCVARVGMRTCDD